MFWVFQKNSFIKKSVESHNLKSVKNFIMKTSAKVFQVCISIVYESFILELSISISTALLLWRWNADDFQNTCSKENDNVAVEKISQ